MRGLLALSHTRPVTWIKTSYSLFDNHGSEKKFIDPLVLGSRVTREGKM